MERNAVLLSVGLLALAGLAGCGSGSGSSSQPISVSLSPKLAAIAAGVQSQQFTANVKNDPSNAGVNWSVDGIAGGSSVVGNITGGGNYSTPPGTAGGTHTITATSVKDPTKSATAAVAVTDLAGVYTYHNNLNRDGTNPQEYALSASTVTTSTFGKLFSCPVDGAVYTQPLWVPGVTFNGTFHNVIYVATQHDSVFAFDADTSPCVQLWQVNLLDAMHGGTGNEQPIIWNDVGNCFGDIYPEVGVTGTPVIDPANGTLFVVSSSEVGTAGGNCSYSPGTFYRRLHALDLVSGNEKFNAPETITASVPGVGDGGTSVLLDPQKHHQRSGLALSNQVVYIPWSAHEDATPYHGWLIGYHESNVQQQVAVFNTTPNGGLGGIWAGGGAPAVDSGGDIYVSTGNGIFDANMTTMPDNDLGDSLLRLHPTTMVTPNGTNLSLAGWFTPFDELNLSNTDSDLGSGGIVLLPDQTTGPPHLLMQTGKEDAVLNVDTVYLIDRDNMGLFRPMDNSQIVQSFPGPAFGLWGTPAFWQNGAYFGGQGDNLKLFTFDPTTGLFSCSPQPCTPVPASQTSNAFNYPGTTPSVSSQGTSNGIVWAIDASLYGYASPNAAGGINCAVGPGVQVPSACTGPAILHAYNATNLAMEYWNSTQAANNRDQAGNAVKFVPPTVANGKVYVSTRTEVDVYGLLPNWEAGLLLHGHGQPIADRQDSGVEVRGVVQLAVKFEDGLGLRVGRILLGDVPAPQHVVGNEQSALAQARGYQAQHAGIIFLVHVVEDDVELLFVLGEELQRVAGVEGDAAGDAGAGKVAAGALGILPVAIGIDDAAFLSHGLGPPDGGVPNGRSQFKHRAGIDHEGQLLEHAGHRRADDGHAVLGGIVLHLGQHLVAPGQQGVEVVIHRS
ncbi:MAG TPA: hypothetical protein VJ999_01100 [Candidatus Sulfotelmatobacter sp.]|nr:hypothetical protein [Candidatus Sulfotelmatobacter sp.]